jgi:hypothetical protein
MRQELISTNQGKKCEGFAVDQCRCHKLFPLAILQENELVLFQGQHTLITGGDGLMLHCPSTT